MLIYTSPTKTLNKSNIISKGSIPFESKTNLLIDELKKLDYKELKDFYSVSDKICDIQYNSIRNKEYMGPSGFVYSGEVFKKLDIKTLNNKEISYLESKLIIGSALYCYTQLFTPINNHRLDFTKKLNNIDLFNYWEDDFYNAFKEELFINISSLEYSKLLKNIKHIDIIFMDNNKIMSTYSKIARGVFLRECSINNVNTIEDIFRLNIIDYKIDYKKSNDTQIIFYR